MGRRKFGNVLTVAHAFGSGTQTDHPVAVSGACYELGLAGIWYQWLWLFATPFYWMISPWMRRLRVLTLGDFFEERYGSKPMAATYAIIGSVGTMAILAVGFTAMSKTIVGLTPKTLDQLSPAELREYEMALIQLCQN